MFNLKRPCVTCPFRKKQGQLFQLAPARLEEIRQGLAFQCHKTVDYGGVDDEGETISGPGDRPEQCAGLMTLLHRLGEPNAIMQIAVRLNALDTQELDPRHECYPTWEAALAAHAGEPE